MACFRVVCRCCAVVALLGVLPAWGQIPPEKRAPLQPPQGGNTCSVQKSCADLAPSMIVSAEGPSPLAENLRHLTDEIGGRMTGSAAADKAAGWAVEAFSHAGVDDVHTEKFTVATGWSEGNTTVTVLAPMAFPVRLVSVGWSPPTVEGGLTADVLDVGVGDDAGFTKAGAAVKGAIVLVHQDVLVSWEDLMSEYSRQPGVIDRALGAGAAAIFWMSTRNGLLLYRHNDSDDGTLEKMHHALYVKCREQAEREASPTACIVDSQSVKSAEKGGPLSILLGSTPAS